jgi:2-dehydropantoate 2-reductase
MKICIYGAGAIGTWLGARLGDPTKNLGHQVNVVARGATLSALQHHGLRLQPVGTVATDDPVTAPVTARANPAELGVQDLIILTVKAPAMREVAQHIGHLIGPDTLVLPAMNGVPWWFLQGFGGAFANTPLHSVDAGGQIATAIAPQHVLGCVVHASCSMLAPGFARQHFGNKLILGEPSNADSPRLQALVDAFQAAGIDAMASNQIQHDVWFKLWGNMSVNPVSALTGATTDLILDDPLVREFISSVMREAKAIGERLGIALDQDPEDRHQVTLKLGAFKTSMLQDVEASHAVELDALVSAVRELGAITGVVTPCTDALLGLARLHARVRGLY